ncbi:metalloprotease MEP1-like protein [Cordyceps fumosorosea ARSEF 2679]|uniref:Metalloprotease MEP1-like protein n=1 Tax=Cordyceps fumosorosea (strain ARSEF 2679) TaxID=1081104 RepID=A0A167VT80_CORFA|nr:metalloprotease MEP1-like protein [Cordyceps fumosorosea ARSEF 2679]OAA62957.1 metalloprotease MEP1-like protein [Cordyceps fumosorosea ARSEF 2679]
MKYTVAVLSGLNALAAASGHHCGTVPNDRVREMHANYAAASAESRLLGLSDITARANYEIQTFFHIITEDDTESGGNISQDTINKQFDYFNKAYSGTGFSFVLNDTKWINEPSWRQLTYDSSESLQMKGKLRQGDYGTLNVYVTTLDSQKKDSTLLGWATFPEKSPTQAQRQKDGVVINQVSLPGMSLYGRTQVGGTLVHETGHWLSLLHTFQGPDNAADDDELAGCRGSGDEIYDTPAEGSPSSRCPKDRDTCTGTLESNNKSSMPGPDPVHNYMDYSDDYCMTEFTKGQMERMRQTWPDTRGK